MDPRVYGVDMRLRILNDEVGPVAPAHSGVPWLALGFRPFFLVCSVYAALSVAIWVATFTGALSLTTSLPPRLWHAHEMVFGFAAAAIAGFLLTAVPNWTGYPTPRGPPLGLLVALWGAGRAATFFQSPQVAAILDLAFLPTVGLALAAPLARAGKWNNLVFLPVLGALTLANGLVWAHELGWRVSAWTGMELALLSVLMLIVLIAGRVIPFFTRAALPESRSGSSPWLERAATASVPILALGHLSGFPPFLLGLLYGLAALLHAGRIHGWYDRRLWRVPLLWVLFIGYGWLCMGFALRGLALLLGGSPFPALHALTVGCMGMLILGMMSRVALGHTGRPLEPSPWVSLAFGLLAAAAALRVLGPLLMPAAGLAWIGLSGGLWALAFGTYAVVYLPILTRKRADGKPG
ncbi:MAG: NnrS family protein [Candidatus Eremiobacterota bacterium]